MGAHTVLNIIYGQLSSSGHKLLNLDMQADLNTIRDGLFNVEERFFGRRS